MFYYRCLNNKINNVHEKALRIVYFDYKSAFQELLDKGGSFSLRHRNMQTLAIEIYKHIHVIRQQLQGKFSKLTELHNITSRTHNEISSRIPKTVEQKQFLFYLRKSRL